MELSQSALLGAMFDAGLAGGKIPSAPAGRQVAAAIELMIMTPIGSRIATRRRARWRTVFPLLYLFPFFASISERDGSETCVDVETCACVARGMVVNRLLSFSVR